MERERLMNPNSVESWIERVAGASQSFVQQNGPHTWLLKQSVYTHFSRLATLLAMPWFQTLTGSVLDVGAGTGALSLDLAWQVGANGHVTAVDHDGEALKIAGGLAGRLGIGISTLAGEATALPVGAATQDTTVARFLFQHLRDPLAALREMRRVTRPGGRIAIFDVDDDVKLCEPLEPQPVADLYQAIRTLQAQRGGNRLIGRALYGLMREAGLRNIQVIVIPRVQMGTQHGRNAELEAYEMERLIRERDGLIESGLMTADDFEAALLKTQQRFGEDRFEMVAEMIATGLLPAG